MLKLRDIEAGYGDKSVLERIVGLIPITAGSIEFNGRALPNARPDEALRAGVSLVAEQRELFLEMSVLDNLRLGAYLRREALEINRDMEYLMDVFPRLRERRHQRSSTLSGGEQQMLAIARALMARPQVLLLDEPSLGLAPQLVDDMFRIIRDINANGTTILLVEQNAVLALEVASFGYVLETGVITAHGPSEDLSRSAAIQASYL